MNFNQISKRVFNRPLSPHLTIYKSQLTSIFSIWHRFTGVLLCLILIIYLCIFKFIPVYIYLYNFNYFPYLWIQNLLYMQILFIFFYHFLNGFRHLSWDLTYNLTIANTSKIIILSSFIFIFLSIFNIWKIIL